jgi:hypothetical protein
MRKKTRPALDVAAVTAAWAKLAEQEKVWTDEELRKLGWMNRLAMEKQFHIGDIASKRMISEGKLEVQQFKMQQNGKTRLYTYLRPKV